MYSECSIQPSLLKSTVIVINEIVILCVYILRVIPSLTLLFREGVTLICSTFFIINGKHLDLHACIFDLNN